MQRKKLFKYRLRHSITTRITMVSLREVFRHGRSKFERHQHLWLQPITTNIRISSRSTMSWADGENITFTRVQIDFHRVLLGASTAESTRNDTSSHRRTWYSSDTALLLLTYMCIILLLLRFTYVAHMCIRARGRRNRSLNCLENERFLSARNRCSDVYKKKKSKNLQGSQPAG
jgi:hypothetical protein